LKLRWITRDGKKVLQQWTNWLEPTTRTDYCWEDVPVEEAPKEPEYYTAIVGKGGDLNWAGGIFSNPDGIRLVDERLVEKLVDALRSHGDYHMRLLEEYRRYIPKKK
jgi:hypothetical protein